MANNEQFGAFISYSRGGSGQLASDLQNGIERFGKPWNKLRAVRVFRDDSSMSANPALWSTIVAGLTESEWLVLLASPEAAASEYVNKEVAWWVQHKSADRILLVRAGGDIEWDPSGGDRPGGDFHHARATAIPPALFGAYAEEPRWIDLTWYAEPDSMGKADPRFNERIVDLASAIRGIPRDTLIGENVAQHRKTRRLTRGAIAGLATLLVLSLAAGGVALAQKSEATRQRDTAETQATIATARQLAATASSMADTDRQMALQLAAYGYQMHPDEFTETTLYTLAGSPESQSSGRFLQAGSNVQTVAGTPDGRVVVAGTEDGRVLRWLMPEGSMDEVLRLDGPIGVVGVSLDGKAIVAAGGPMYRGGGVSYVADEGKFEAAIWRDGTAQSLDYEPRAISPSGRLIAEIVSSTGTGLLRVHDGANTRDYALGNPGSVGTVLFPDDDSAVIGGVMGEPLRIDFRSGATSKAPIYFGAANNFGMAFSANGKFAAGSQGSIDLEVYPFSAGPVASAQPLWARADDAPIGLALSASGKLAATSSNGRIVVSAVSTAKEPAPTTTIIHGTGQPNEQLGGRQTLQFLGDELLLNATGTHVGIWPVTPSAIGFPAQMPDHPGKPEYAGAATVAVNTDGSRAVVLGPDGNAMTMLDLQNRTSQFLESRGGRSTLPEGAARIDRVAWIDNDILLAFSGSDQRAWLLTGDALSTVDSTWPVSFGDDVEVGYPWELDAMVATPSGDALLGTSGGDLLRLDRVQETLTKVSCQDAQGINIINAEAGGYNSFAFDPNATSVALLQRQPDGTRTRIVGCDLSQSPSGQPGRVFIDRELPDDAVAGQWLEDGSLLAWVLPPKDHSGTWPKNPNATVWRIDPTGSSVVEVGQSSPPPRERNWGTWAVRSGPLAAWTVGGSASMFDAQNGAEVELGRWRNPLHSYTSVGASRDGSTLLVADESTDTAVVLSTDPQVWVTAACSLAGGGEIAESDWERITGVDPSQRPQCGATGEAIEQSIPSNPSSQAASSPPVTGALSSAPATPTYTFYGQDTTQYGEPFTSYLVIRRSGDEVKFLEDPANAQPSCFIGRREDATTLEGLYLPPRQSLVEASQSTITLVETEQGVTWERLGWNNQRSSTLRTPSPADEARLTSAVDECDPNNPQAWGRQY